MNLREATGSLQRITFRFLRAIMESLPRRRIDALGAEDDRISSILVINLDRQPLRLKRMHRELGRFLTRDGFPLLAIARRVSAVDARDGRSVAATADVDSTYRIGDQLHVQPDARLKSCFSPDEPIMMTRQEIAVAQSHVEVWKIVAEGRHRFVLVLEDDVYFKWGAAAAISRGWDAALRRYHASDGPRLLYLSYADAGGTAERADVCGRLFRPVRGLWFLSGYVLSRDGAAALLRAMPVVGPVDLWMNYRLQEVGALALTSPAILQRCDSGSDNSYSVMPYLARAGIVDSGIDQAAPNETGAGPVLAWTSKGSREDLAMALSMLGLRVCVFNGDEEVILEETLAELWDEFDALVDAPLAMCALRSAIARADAKFLLDNASPLSGLGMEHLPPSRTKLCTDRGSDSSPWVPLCALLGLAVPVATFPQGSARHQQTFRDGRRRKSSTTAQPASHKTRRMDSSPWILPPRSRWQPGHLTTRHASSSGGRLLVADLTAKPESFTASAGTFPGNLAWFSHDCVTHDGDGTHLVLSEVDTRSKPYRSGALASRHHFEYGRFEVDIRAAFGPGLITGLFLHRDAPRQEIDIELPGDEPRRLLVNVYFNPGDDGAPMNFGYRGSPLWIDLEFDTTKTYHRYAIEWRPGLIAWSVDGQVVHERAGWDPTPIPHLPMRLHANLWAPRSKELAGQIDPRALPTRASFRNVLVKA